MSARTQAKAPSRKVTPPSGSYMSNDQFASYLADLRNSRLSRPGGARPLPPNANSGGSSRRASGRLSLGRRASAGSSAAPAAESGTANGTANTATSFPSHNFSFSHQHSQSDAPSGPPASYTSGHPSLGSHTVAGSMSSRYSNVTGHGRDYYPAKTPAQQIPPPLKPDEVVPTDVYMERGQRWIEKEEVVSLRHALEDMDLRQRPEAAVPTKVADADEQRIYNAALDEAAELVWQHQNGVKPPEPGAPYQYKQHLRKNSYAYARTASVGRYGDDIEPTGLARDCASRSASGSSCSSYEASGSRRSRHSYGSSRAVSGASQCSDGGGSVSGSGSGSGSNSARQSLDHTYKALVANSSTGGAPSRTKAYAGLTGGGSRPMMSTAAAANSVAAAGTRRRSSMKRNISGEIEKPFSGDQIYEEPEGETPDKKRAKTAAAVSALGGSSILQTKPEAAVNSKDAGGGFMGGVSKLISRYEIHRNPPSQSRNPQYTTNPVPSQAPSQQQQHQLCQPNDTAIATPPDGPRKNGVEIRSNDIRQATSMKLKDRNSALPTPSFVSDSPGRPIVSFDANWKVPVDKAATDAEPDARDKSCHIGGNTYSSISSSQPSTNVGSTSRRRNIFARHQEPPAAAVASPAGDRPAPAFPSQQRHQQHEARHAQISPPQPQQQQQARNIFSKPRAAQMSNGSAPTNTAPIPIPTIAAITGSEEPKAALMSIPTISVTAEPDPPRQQPIPIPAIVLPDDEGDSATPSGGAPIPQISISCSDDNSVPRAGGGPPIPIIVTSDDAGTEMSGSRTPSGRSAQPPVISRTPASQPSARPLPKPAPRGGGHWSRAPNHHTAPPSCAGSVAGSRATARCHECRYPIEGRFIALAGIPDAGVGSERFHPQCFRCYLCGTMLEALEILPEPDEFRSARLHRISRRAHGEILEEAPGQTMGEDGDDRLRFYCHLDWHELFAPRCKHCTTPILGEHVVALGAHWHVGHFFCAECGDPFGPGATHIEKDGYAWCVSCQTRRTERRAPKCRACGKAVIGQYVQALAAEWHDECFRCAVCAGGFDDGQIFPREGAGGLMQVVCTGCRQRELKA